jgi:hypothetical protein
MLITSAFAPWPTIEQDNGALKKVKPYRRYNGPSETKPGFPRKGRFYLRTFPKVTQGFIAPSQMPEAEDHTLYACHTVWENRA